MGTVVTKQILSAIESAINAGNLALARKKLSDIDLGRQQNGRIFELAAIVELQSGQPDQAEGHLLKGISCANASGFCYYLLGSLYLSRQDFDKAVEKLKEAISKGARFVESYYNLGMALFHLSRHEEALRCFDEAIKLNQNSLHGWYGRGAVLHGMGQLEEAEKALLRALMLNPNLTDAQVTLGYVYHAMGRRKEALIFMKEALPKVQEARQKEHLTYLIAAMGDAAAPDRAPDDYVRDLFDRYAPRFEEDLVGRLGYKTPELIQERLTQWMPKRWMCALDMGCGTGLWGKLARPHCEKLVALDISPKMIERAADLGIYDELHCDEIVKYLSPLQAKYDLVVAADVFVYIGNLADVFASTRQAMMDDGVFAFSVELLDAPADAPGYAILPSGRYAHVDAYVRDLAASQGFSVLDHFEGSGRQEHDKPVKTGFYVLRCQAGRLTS